MLGVLLDQEVDEVLDGTLGVGGARGSSGLQQVVPLEEVGVLGTVGETLPGNTDTLQHTVALKLVEDDLVHDITRALLDVGQDATDEVRVGGPEGVHQMGQLLLVLSGDGHERGTGGPADGSLAA